MTVCPQIREGEHAIIVRYCCVTGRRETAVRKFRVGEVRPYAQHAFSVGIDFMMARQRRWRGYRVCPTGVDFYTIERDGRVIYDSRLDVPLDMETWQRRYGEGKVLALHRLAKSRPQPGIDSGYDLDHAAWERE